MIDKNSDNYKTGQVIIAAIYTLSILLFLHYGNILFMALPFIFLSFGVLIFVLLGSIMFNATLSNKDYQAMIDKAKDRKVSFHRLLNIAAMFASCYVFMFAGYGVLAGMFFMASIMSFSIFVVDFFVTLGEKHKKDG